MSALGLIRPSPHALDTHGDDIYGHRVFLCAHCGERVGHHAERYGSESVAHLVFGRGRGEELRCVTVRGTNDAVDELVDGIRQRSRRTGELELVEDM